ncbi:protein-disulfide isomerase [Roseobacter denitrificans]|uniref:Protein-disulfide isomerase, putative n=1 Tax=Roseobacter denitrificans (strain ATCC 33942 / OCh 114) TaxID=375451 RepID=Q16DM3_ROSDO|nr:DsbA family protein [Roseobacter denitrificans]ABG29920.1 protein-disulfide isomerase, putative [Roseobacter denitrificans OCh 114]AVL53132.1 protein-disulfide isomerase [Roseobacter denitrificans]SFG38199.1 DSBA-like thioredoxin domain-containing protein [Roseobacter denitrificans OCh 114]
MRRRDLLVGGGIVAVAVAIPPILRRIPTDFEFEPLPGFAGFRRITGGSVSAASNPFLGLEPPDPSTPAPQRAGSPCVALFGPEGWQTGVVPIAIFSDFNCPYCKVLENRLMERRDAGAPVRLIWHEMPLLGAASRRSAQAVLAARFFDAEEAARAYLSQRFLRPGPVALRAMAHELGLPPDAFAQEVSGPRVAQALATSLDLGRRLGIPGTPGTVIGRTLVIGATNDADLTKLIEIESAQPQMVCA